MEDADNISNAEGNSSSTEQTGNGGTVDPTIGKSGSKQHGGNNGAGRTDSGIKGVIDPEVARAASGNDFTGASIEQPAAEPGKRGRHKRDCECANCTAKRATSGSTAAAPETKNTKTKNLTVVGIDKILFSIHMFCAMTLQIPELVLKEDEAKQLSDAIRNVNEQFKIALDPKTAAYIELAQVAGIIYGPRAVAFYLRKKSTPPKTVAPNTSTVSGPVMGVDFDPTKQKMMN